MREKTTNERDTHVRPHHFLPSLCNCVISILSAIATFHFIPLLLILTLHCSSISLCSPRNHILLSISHTIISFTSSVPLLHFHTFTPFQQRISANSKKFSLCFLPNFLPQKFNSRWKRKPRYVFVITLSHSCVK